MEAYKYNLTYYKSMGDYIHSSKSQLTAVYIPSLGLSADDHGNIYPDKMPVESKEEQRSAGDISDVAKIEVPEKIAELITEMYAIGLTLAKGKVKVTEELFGSEIKGPFE